MTESVKMLIDGNEIEFPVVEGSEKEKGIDISTLRAKTGYIMLDNGLGNTGSCRSAVTFLNGEKGILRYRGYPIEQLAEHSSFLEVSWLLHKKELPNNDELESYRANIASKGQLPAGIITLVDSFPLDAHPMAVLSSATVALSAYYPEYCKAELNDQERDEVMELLMAQLISVATYFYRRTQGKKLIPYDQSLGYCENFLSMMFGGQNVDSEIAKAIDVLLVLHADHEQNCSASTVRVIGSGQANVFASVAGGISALWGPLHGGANQAVIEMLDAIQKDGGDHTKFLAKAKDKSDPFRLMGFGHRVYKNFDPRAKIIKSACDTILGKLGVHDPVLDIAKGLEEEALKDPYFVERKLYPNVDFYSGIIYRALNIPTNMFTVMFVLGRLPGWLAQWGELLTSKNFKITRPRQIYVGENERNYKK